MLGVAGALIGIGLQLVVLAMTVAGLILLQEYLGPKPDIENQRPASLGDFQVPTATQARVVPMLWGTSRQKGPNVVWYGDLEQVAVTESIKTGLWTRTRIVVGFEYFLGIQFGIARGDSTMRLRRIWIGEDEVFSGNLGEGTLNIDRRELFGGAEFGQGGVEGTCRFHIGTRIQSPNFYISNLGEQTVGGITPRYSGTSYLVFEHGYIGNSIQLRPWSFEVSRFPNGLGLADPTVNTLDLNPMCAVYEIATDTEWGLRYGAAEIDVPAFQAAAATLLSEGNGFSLMLDRPFAAEDIIEEIARQIDGSFFEDPRTGLYTVVLARFDYDIDTVPLLTSPIRVEKFTNGTWSGRINQIKVQFANRNNDYNDDFALSQNTAGALIQGGGTVTTLRPVTAPATYPGVKDATLANQIAWRDLRAQGQPLTGATLVVDRSFYTLRPGDVFAWTDTVRGFTRKAMRVGSIDYGTLQNPEIKIQCAEDIWRFLAGAFAPPPPTMWQPPANNAVAFPVAEQIAFEAPRAFVFRNLGAPGQIQPLVWGSGRRTARAIGFRIRERNVTPPTTPSGAFNDIGSSLGFMLMGELNANLGTGTAIPTTSIQLDATPDTQTVIEEAFTDSTNTQDVGTNLVNLILVGDELMLVMSAQVSGGGVQLDNVYRGVCDTAQQAHTAGDPVYLVFAGGNLGDDPIPETNNVHVKLLPQTDTETLGEVLATQIAFTMDRRNRRPYCPSRVSLEGNVFATTASLEGAGTGPEGVAIDVTEWIRRDFRTADGDDEIRALTVDGETLRTDFPSLHGYSTDIRVVNDPDGAATTLFTLQAVAGQSQEVLRIDILQATDGIIPTRMRLELIGRHTEAGDELISRHFLRHDFDVTTALTGQFEFGALNSSDISALYNATVAGNYVFTLSTAYGSGTISYRLNGGSFTTLIAAGGTNGTIVGVAISDTIELQHNSPETAFRQLDMNAPGAGQDGFAILFS